MSSRPYIAVKADLLRQQASEVIVVRSLIDITALDLQIQEELAKYGNLKEFTMVVWRHELDAIKCN